MDCITDPDVREIVIVGPSQLLKSEIILNAIGYFIHLDPCPMLMIQPDDKNAEEFSKDRIATMIEATPELRERVYKRQGGRSIKKSTKYNIGFPGGYLSIASSNSPASLASKPIRNLFPDEVDRYALSSGDEGDVVELGKRRLTTFWNSLCLQTSSPGRKDSSLILSAYEASDQREYYVPCVLCGETQTFEMGDKDTPYGLKWEPGRPDTAHYLCRGCQGELWEADKLEAVRHGQWQRHAPFTGTAGFKINALYSPWFSWEKLVAEFLKVKDDPKKLQVFVNTRLAEGWEDLAESVSDDTLLARREPYRAEVPMGAFVLTCFVDVQGDRLEALVQGWGVGEECWNIEHAVFWGSPDETETWDTLEWYLGKQFQHESGIKLPLSVTGIDSGYKANTVYDFVQRMGTRRIFATKGQSGWGQPILKSPSRSSGGAGRRKVDLHIVGVDEAKDTVMRRLRKPPGSPYSYHFPKSDWCDDEFFKQLTAEKIVLEKDKRGYRQRVWEKKNGRRNEVWDLHVGNFAMTKRLPANWQSWRESIIPKHLDAPDPDRPGPDGPTTKASTGTPHPGRRVRSQGLRKR